MQMQDYRQQFLNLFTNCICEIYINLKKSGKEKSGQENPGPASNKSGKFYADVISSFLLEGPPCSLRPRTSTRLCEDELHLRIINLHDFERSRFLSIAVNLEREQN